jgi:hypothetical protein
MYKAEQAAQGAQPEEPAGATAGRPDGEKKDQDTIEGEFTEKPS